MELNSDLPGLQRPSPPVMVSGTWHHSILLTQVRMAANPFSRRACTTFNTPSLSRVCHG